MAVTLTKIDLTRAGGGELTDAMFPDGDMETLLALWLAQAAARVEAQSGIAAADQNAAAAAWVYYRAYSQMATDASLEPASFSAGDINISYKSGRRVDFSALAAAKLAEYERYNESGAVDIAPRHSVSVPMRARW